MFSVFSAACQYKKTYYRKRRSSFFKLYVWLTFSFLYSLEGPTKSKKLLTASDKIPYFRIELTRRTANHCECCVFHNLTGFLKL